METVVLKFTDNTQFNDDELFEFCLVNKELRIERDKDGQIIIMAPTGTSFGKWNFKISGMVSQWVMANEELGYGFDSSTGFRLPNGAMRSPDTAWVKKEKWEQLSLDEQDKFAPITPDFVIEVRSKSDSLKELQNKMLEWIENGCRLAWLIDPLEEKAYVYTSSGLVKTSKDFSGKLEGAEVLPGFELDLSMLK